MASNDGITKVTDSCILFIYLFIYLFIHFFNLKMYSMIKFEKQIGNRVIPIIPTSCLSSLINGILQRKNICLDKI